MKFKLFFISSLFIFSFFIGGCMSMIFEQPQDETVNIKMWYYDRDSDGVVDEYIGLYNGQWKCYHSSEFPETLEEKDLYTCDKIIINTTLTYLSEFPKERTREIEQWLKEQTDVQ